MNALSGRKRSHKIVVGLLVISVLLDRCLIAPAAPALSEFAGINPMIVILDIPLGLPSACSIITVSGIFVALYWILVLPYDSLHDRTAWRQARKRVGKVSGGVLAIPACVIAGGLTYEAFQDRLPKYARHAIESFGINTDLYTAYPGYERIRLRGSMVMLCCFFIGLYIFSRKIGAADLIRLRSLRPAPELSNSPGLSDSPGLSNSSELSNSPGLPDAPGLSISQGGGRSPAPRRSPIPLSATPAPTPALPDNPHRQPAAPGIYIRYPDPPVRRYPDPSAAPYPPLHPQPAR